jgi:hypothetical protein
MTVGTVVKLLTPMLGEQLHSVGVVFHDYGDGVQVIFTDGGYDGFSKEEQKSYLLETGTDPLSTCYGFKNVINMERDYEKGLWNHVFRDDKYRAKKQF